MRELPGLFCSPHHVLSLTISLVHHDTKDACSLLASAQQGDAEAFCELCRIHGPRLFRQAVVLCGDPGLAEDLAQEAFLEAWKCIPRYNGRCQFFTWLCAILLNRFRKRLRQKRPLPFSSLAGAERNGAETLVDSLPDPASSPDSVLQEVERAAAVRECLGRLPEKHREVIHLRFYVDDSLEGIAAALGCSVGTVKSRLFHALEKLRAMNQLNIEHRDRSPAQTKS
jgi:RNA polymerase sigma-70 factor, ECF subfamily